MSARQKAEAEARECLLVFSEIEHRRIADALESKIKEIETLREAAGKLRESVEKISNWETSSHSGANTNLFGMCREFAERSLKEFDKAMGK